MAKAETRDVAFGCYLRCEITKYKINEKKKKLINNIYKYWPRIESNPTFLIDHSFGYRCAYLPNPVI